MLRLADQQRAHDKEARQAVGSLTPREREVMVERLYISRDGAQPRRAHIERVHSRLQALVFAARLGIVEID